jgi:N-methylhydantoinase A
MPFGGAGPLFGTLLAGELEIKRIVVPSYAGNFSAWGLLGASLTQTAARTRITRLADGAEAEIDAVLAELFEVLDARAEGREFVRETALDMRYVGQEHSLTVSVPGDGRLGESLAEIRDRFVADYARTFDHTLEEEIEIVSIRAVVRTALPRRAAEQKRAASDNGGPATTGTVDAWSFTRGERMPFALVARDSIDTDGIAGPAIVLEETATTYVDADFHAARGAGDILVLTDTKGA